MTISTYATLQTAMAEWLIREDLTARIPTFIQLCEATLQRALKTGDQELSTTLTTTANVATVALPTGFTGQRRLRLLADGVYRDVPVISLMPSLDNGVTSSRPVSASVRGANFFLRPTPDTAYSMPLDYYGKFTPLSTTDTTNWILTSHPDAYLYGSLLHSAPYLGTDERISLWSDAFKDVVAQINRFDFEKRFGKVTRRCDPAVVSTPRFNIFTGRGY